MKIAWILWWIATIFWGVVAIGLLVFTLMNGLNSGIEWYKFTFIMIGIFLVPIICQVVWLIINLIVSKNFKESQYN